MHLDVYVCDGAYYIRGPDNAALKWTWEDGRWCTAKGVVPVNAVAADPRQIPSGLREELMAFAARAATMGNQIWSMVN